MADKYNFYLAPVKNRNGELVLKDGKPQVVEMVKVVNDGNSVYTARVAGYEASLEPRDYHGFSLALTAWRTRVGLLKEGKEAAANVGNLKKLQKQQAEAAEAAAHHSAVADALAEKIAAALVLSGAV